MVSEDVWVNLPPDLEIVELEERRAELKQGKIDGHPDEEEICQLTEEIRKRRAQRDKQVVKQYRKHYFYNHPTWNMERHARGEELEYEEPVINVTVPERARLAEIFCHQPDDLSED